jgi:hypothetical protein
LGLIGVAKLPHGPSRRVRRRVAADLPGGAASVPDRRPRAVSACELLECAVLIATLGKHGVAVSVAGDRVVFGGDVRATVIRRRSVGAFLDSARETLDGRTAAVAAALARGPAFGLRIAEERRVASAAIRRGRKVRTNHAKKNLSLPAAAAGSSIREIGGESVSARRPLPPVVTFSLDGEPA